MERFGPSSVLVNAIETLLQLQQEQPHQLHQPQSQPQTHPRKKLKKNEDDDEGHCEELVEQRMERIPMQPYDLDQPTTPTEEEKDFQTKKGNINVNDHGKEIKTQAAAAASVESLNPSCPNTRRKEDTSNNDVNHQKVTVADTSRSTPEKLIPLRNVQKRKESRTSSTACMLNKTTTENAASCSSPSDATVQVLLVGAEPSSSLDSSKDLIPKSCRKLQMNGTKTDIEVNVEEMDTTKKDNESLALHSTVKKQNPPSFNTTTTTTTTTCTPKVQKTPTEQILMTPNPQSSISFRNSFGGRVKNLDSCSSNHSRGGGGTGRRRRRKLYGASTNKIGGAGAGVGAGCSPFETNDKETNVVASGPGASTSHTNASIEIEIETWKSPLVTTKTKTNRSGGLDPWGGGGGEDEFAFHSQSSQPDGILL
jgi:hypothetical protein